MKKIKEEYVHSGGAHDCRVGIEHYKHMAREISIRLDDGRTWIVYEGIDGQWSFSTITAGKRSMTLSEERELYTAGSRLRKQLEDAAGITLGFTWDQRTIDGALAKEAASK